MVSVVVQEEDEIIGFFLARFLVDTVEERYLLLAEKSGNLLVREDHEFLDDFMRFRAVALRYAHDLSLSIRQYLHFLEIEVYLPLICTSFIQYTLEFKSILDERDDFGRVFFENASVRFLAVRYIDEFLDFVIGKSLLRFYERLIDPGREDLSCLVELHDDAQSRLGTAGVERTEIIREVFWEHRDNLIWRIDTGSAMVCLTVEDRILDHILGNIRDMDSELEVPVCEFLDSDGIIEVFRIGSVDGHNPFCTQIHTTRGHVFCLKFLRFREDALWKFFHDGVLVENDTFCHTRTILMTENGNHFSMRLILVPENSDSDHLVIFRTERITVGDEYILASESFYDLSESIGILGAFDVLSDERFLGTLHESDDFCLSFLAIETRFGDLYFYGIAIQSSIAFTFPDEKYLTERSFDESEVRLDLGINSGTILGFHDFWDDICVKYTEEQKKCEFLFVAFFYIPDRYDLHEHFLELLLELFDGTIVFEDEMGDFLESTDTCLGLCFGLSDELFDGLGRIGGILPTKSDTRIAGRDIGIDIDEFESLKIPEVLDIALSADSVDDDEGRGAPSDVCEDDLRKGIVSERLSECGRELLHVVTALFAVHAVEDIAKRIGEPVDLGSMLRNEVFREGSFSASHLSGECEYYFLHEK